MNWPIDVFDKALSDASELAAAARGQRPPLGSMLLSEIMAEEAGTFRHWWHGKPTG